MDEDGDCDGSSLRRETFLPEESRAFIEGRGVMAVVPAGSELCQKRNGPSVTTLESGDGRMMWNKFPGRVNPQFEYRRYSADILQIFSRYSRGYVKQCVLQLKRSRIVVDHRDGAARDVKSEECLRTQLDGSGGWRYIIVVREM